MLKTRKGSLTRRHKDQATKRRSKVNFQEALRERIYIEKSSKEENPHSRRSLQGGGETLKPSQEDQRPYLKDLYIQGGDFYLHRI